MIPIKPPFEEIVTDNTKWLLRYIRQKIRNPSIAEDLLQETFLKAFRNYDNYVENGKIKAWLMRIAANTINNNFTGKNLMTNMIISFDDYDYDFIETLVDDSDLPDDIVIHDETVKRILAIINNLNDRDREIMYYRYIYNMSVEATSEKLGIPQGTVKSRTHNTIIKIQKQLGVETAPKMKGVHIMTCNEAYKYLFVYAKGVNQNEEVTKHIAECQHCADVVTALKNLIPHIQYAPDDEITHFNIRIDSGIYSIIKSPNISPDGYTEFGYNGDNGFVGIFDGDGNELEFKDELRTAENSYHRVRVFFKSYKEGPMEEITVYPKGASTFTQSKESSNLYNVTNQNFFGGHVLTSLISAIPKEATNIRIKRGNGVIDCGTYKFVYVSRYTDGEEGIHLDATFNM